jgi:DNA-binding transcriptional regulator YiaG
MTSETFCLHGDEVRNEPVLYRACGLDEIFLLNGYELVEHDGEQHLSVKKMDELHEAIGRHLVMHRKALAPKEIKFLRNTMNVTQSELAQRLGNNVQSVARWEKGETEVPGASEKLLRLVYLTHFITDEDMSMLRKFVRDTLNVLDELDETKTVQGRFQFDDKWLETDFEEKLSAYA